MPDSPSGVVPYPLAMVVSDAVHADPSTGKKTILGTFSSILATAFPAVHPALAVFLAFTDCVGKIPLRLCLVTVDDEGDPVFDVSSEVQSSDRRAVIEAVFQLNGVLFPEPGEYRLQAHACGQFLIERRILVINPQESIHE